MTTNATRALKVARAAIDALDHALQLDPAAELRWTLPLSVEELAAELHAADLDYGAPNQHGPWSHPHTEQARELLTDPYANDHAQRRAALAPITWEGGPPPLPRSLLSVWREHATTKRAMTIREETGCPWETACHRAEWEREHGLLTLAGTTR